MSHKSCERVSPWLFDKGPGMESVIGKGCFFDHTVMFVDFLGMAEVLGTLSQMAFLPTKNSINQI